MLQVVHEAKRNDSVCLASKYAQLFYVRDVEVREVEQEVKKIK